MLKVDPQDKCVRHYTAVLSYENLVRNVEYVITLPPKKRPDVEVSYVLVTTALDNICTSAPPIQRGRVPRFEEFNISTEK
jgi:hypothetical protein